MAEIVQAAGGHADVEAEYTGPEREIRIDTDNKDLLLQDGATPGGFRILNRDNSDERYQARSTELDGIGPYTPEQRGILVRRGPGEYRLRKITVSSAFTLSNGDGYGGNINLVLSGEIDQDFRFLQDVIIEGGLDAIGGINGDTAGTHYGTVVGNLTGNGTGNFNGNFTGNLIGKHTGALDARNSVVQFSDGAIPLVALAALDAQIKLLGTPVGGIIMWSGSSASIPAGWHLCDGTSGTVDLRDRFIVGAGGSYIVGATGGSSSSSGDTESAGAHTHTGSAVSDHTLTVGEIPPHTHSMNPAYAAGGSGWTTGSAGGGPLTGGTNNATESTGGGNPHGHGLTIVEQPAHTHGVEVDTLPPYYALCFIQHIG